MGWIFLKVSEKRFGPDFLGAKKGFKGDLRGVNIFFKEFASLKKIYMSFNS